MTSSLSNWRPFGAAVLALAALGCGRSPASLSALKPNIVLYVIDGGAAELMSVYGYWTRTTPCLERLAAEGAIFENAYSNSSFTKVSVPSFMTSLQSSVLGGFRSESDPLPARAVTMAERLHQAGYWTMVLTANPFCGRISSLDRGVDVLKEPGVGEAYRTSADLGREFWRLREGHPAEPYWAHFQSTDVHRPWEATGRPFGGEIDSEQYSRIARPLYEEAMLLQDREIYRLVESLKSRGEWERTLFVVAADHSQESAGLPFLDPQAPPWEAPILASQKSRIPMILVWPGRIPAGRRIGEPVSMIDLLPTVLDLAGLPPLEVAQGRSLAPLLLGQSGWKPRPVVLDEFYSDGASLFGSLEVIDGRFGASLRIDPRPEGKRSSRDLLRPSPLLVFDVQADPHALKPINKERPDLVAKYSRMLRQLWQDDLVLGRRFTRAGSIPMTPGEIKRLRSLGYLR
jgi:arylsulfatase A-like enzyme